MVEPEDVNLYIEIVSSARADKKGFTIHHLSVFSGSAYTLLVGNAGAKKARRQNGAMVWKLTIAACVLVLKTKGVSLDLRLSFSMQ